MVASKVITINVNELKLKISFNNHNKNNIPTVEINNRVCKNKKNETFKRFDFLLNI